MSGYRFGIFSLDLDRQELLAGDRAVGLPRKNFEVLQVLVRAEGRLLSREELARAAWPDTVVEEATLRQNIYTLRNLLREIDSGREYVETVPKAGYRMAVPVERLEDQNDLAPVSQVAKAGWYPSWRTVSMTVAAVVFLVATVSIGRWRTSSDAGVNRQAIELDRQAWVLLYQRNSENFLAVETLFDDAIRLNPQLASAHEGKAILYALQAKEAEAESEAGRAVALEPSSGVYRVVRGFNRMMYHWDWAEAKRQFGGSTEPNCSEPVCRQWHALYLGLTGPSILAVRKAADAVELNPARLSPRADLTHFLYWDGQYDAAIDEGRTVVAAGGAWTQVRQHLWKALLAKGDRHSAAETVLLAIDPAWYRLRASEEEARLWSTREKWGTAEFWSQLFTMEERGRGWSYMLAELAMAKGDTERAMAELEKCLKARSFFLPFAKRDPLFAPLHGKARYEAVMKGVGL